MRYKGRLRSALPPYIRRAPEPCYEPPARCPSVRCPGRPRTRRRLAPVDGPPARQRVARNRARSTSFPRAARESRGGRPSRTATPAPRWPTAACTCIDFVTERRRQGRQFRPQAFEPARSASCASTRPPGEVVEARVPGHLHHVLPRRPALHAARCRRQGLHTRRRGQAELLRRGDRRRRVVEEFHGRLRRAVAAVGLRRPPARRRREAHLHRRRRRQPRRRVRQGHRRGDLAGAHVAPIRATRRRRSSKPAACGSSSSCSPTAITSVDPDTGAEHWSVPYAATTAASSCRRCMSGDYLFVGGHQNKSVLLKLTARQARRRGGLARQGQGRDLAGQRAAVRRRRRDVRRRSARHAARRSTWPRASSCGKRRSRWATGRCPRARRFSCGRATATGCSPRPASW